MNILVIPQLSFRTLVTEALRRSGRVTAEISVSESRPDWTWLVRETPLGQAKTDRARNLLAIEISSAEPAVLPEPQGVVGTLIVGDGRLRGRAWGHVLAAGVHVPFDLLALPGPGMHCIRVENGAAQPDAPAPQADDGVEKKQRWSRTAGALGGKDVLERLANLRVGIVGCGRTGSLVAAGLARGLGVRHVTLIDGDWLEWHNIGEMDAVTERDVNKSKAELVARRLRGIFLDSPPEIVPIVEALGGRKSMAAARACDVLFCCADNDSTRLTAALLAALHHRVLIDVGTGIRSAPRTPRAQTRDEGADVRLIVPGQGCLLCRGGLARYGQAVRDILSRKSPAAIQGDWRRGRDGSLRSLNQIAAGMALHLFEDLVAARAPGSLWAHMEFDAAGKMSVTYPAPTANPATCPLCIKAGLGDRAFQHPDDE